MSITIRYLFLFLFAFILGSILFTWQKGMFLAIFSTIIVFLTRRYIR